MTTPTIPCYMNVEDQGIVTVELFLGNIVFYCAVYSAVKAVYNVLYFYIDYNYHFVDFGGSMLCNFNKNIIF